MIVSLPRGEMLPYYSSMLYVYMLDRLPYTLLISLPTHRNIHFDLKKEKKKKIHSVGW